MITESRLHQLECYIQNLIDSEESKYYNELLFIQKSHPPVLAPVPKPIIPKTMIPNQLFSIQKYIEQLGYNHLGEPFFTVKKHYSTHKLCKLAAEMISCGLPIKCLEATVLAMYLTMQIEDIDRIPLAFKSVCEGKVYRHIVLVIRHGDVYGALGLSRRKDLMNKPTVFKSLSDLVHEYKISYQNNYHRLDKIKIGLPVTHQMGSNEAVVWKSVSIHLAKPWLSISREIDIHARSFRKT
jgi:hypothetical protein